MHSPRDRRMTKPLARRPLRPTGVDGMGPAAARWAMKSIAVFDGNHCRRPRALQLARISHEWCPKLYLGEGKGVGSWVAGAKMPTERGNWAWMTGVEGNGDVKSDYRDSYPEQRREGWDV